MGTITVHRRKVLLDEVRQRHAEEVRVCNETSAENVESLINDVEVVKSVSVRVSLERNLVVDCFEEHVCALLALVERQRRTVGNENGPYGRF